MGFLCQGARPAAGWAQGLIRSGKRAKKKPPVGTGGFYVIVTELKRPQSDLSSFLEEGGSLIDEAAVVVSRHLQSLRHCDIF